MPRFAVLFHDWPLPHYDLLLEADGVLKAWRLAEEPLDFNEIAVENNFDHRLMYLDFEGTLTGDRGSVKCWDRGELKWLSSDVFELSGFKLIGSFSIREAILRRVYV